MLSSRSPHPQVEALRRKRLAAGARPLHELSVGEAREVERSELHRLVTLPEPVADVLERSATGPAGELAVRVYRPQASSSPLPALVYFFGGGWVLGSLDAVDAVCRRLANATPCAVVSVAYRRAPEHPFPAAVEDCYAVTCWVAEHAAELRVDPDRIAVGGASAGGNLAAAVAQLARRGGPRLAFQLLVYPLLDCRADAPSMAETFDPLFFNAPDAAWCWSHYLAREADGENPFASPLRAPDLRGLPPALVITAELDPLRDEGELYARRLVEAGVPGEAVRFEGVVHGFFSSADRLDAAVQAQALAASSLARAFGRRT